MLWHTLFGIGLAATLLTLSFPPFEFPYFAWVALVPLLHLIKRLRVRCAALVFLAVGMCFYHAHVWWMLRIDGVHLGNLSLSLFGNALYFGLFGLVARYCHAKAPGWNAVTFPSIWVLIEYLKSHVGFLSFPWGILGYSQYAILPVAQLSAWTGVYGVSFLVVMVNTLVAEMLPVPFPVLGLQHYVWAVLARRLWTCAWRPFILVVICITAAFSYTLSAVGEDEVLPRLKVALVQASLYSEKTAHIRPPEAVFQNFSRLSVRAAASRPRLIVWPASSVPARFPYERLYVHHLSRLARETKAFLLIGSYGYDKLSAKAGEKRFANSIFLISPEGKIISRYDKIRLLPFDEYLPLRGYVKWPAWIVADGPDALPGTKMTVFATDTARFGVQICWENLFPDLFRKVAAQRVDFMVSVTNESFIDLPAAHYQMLAMNVFRAIENHVAIVRVAPTGVSSIISPTGHIVARVQDANEHDVNIEGYLAEDIPLVVKRSFYNRHGDWFVILLAVIVVGFLSAPRVQPRKSDGPRPAH